MEFAEPSMTHHLYRRAPPPAKPTQRSIGGAVERAAQAIDAIGAVAP
jgi:hypothetical protein